MPNIEAELTDFAAANILQRWNSAPDIGNALYTPNPMMLVG